MYTDWWAYKMRLLLIHFNNTISSRGQKVNQEFERDTHCWLNGHILRCTEPANMPDYSYFDPSAAVLLKGQLLNAKRQLVYHNMDTDEAQMVGNFKTLVYNGISFFSVKWQNQNQEER